MDQKTQQPQKPPSLEIVSRVFPESQTPASEKRRRPRLCVTSEQFRLSATGKIFSVVDLSLEGMGIRVIDRGDFQIFPIAAEVLGTLNFHGEKLPVCGKVRRLGSDIVGCEFEKLAPDVNKTLERFLDPVELGRELKPIPAGDAGTTWYHGPTGTDLILWRGVDGQYRRLTLYLLGSFIQWEEGEGLTTGAVLPSNIQSEVRGVVRFETLLMNQDLIPAADKLNLAKTLLASSNLPPDLKKWCLRHFEA